MNKCSFFINVIKIRLKIVKLKLPLGATYIFQFLFYANAANKYLQHGMTCKIISLFSNVISYRFPLSRLLPLLLFPFRLQKASLLTCAFVFLQEMISSRSQYRAASTYFESLGKSRVKPIFLFNGRTLPAYVFLIMRIFLDIYWGHSVPSPDKKCCFKYRMKPHWRRKKMSRVSKRKTKAEAWVAFAKHSM